jgi:hypothetical protein
MDVGGWEDAEHLRKLLGRILSPGKTRTPAVFGP